ncbi:MAG: hypothetical protein JWO31_2167 [Phycisphaerales bacterium]|nr:hypothetical protein [Phycisphaerales bacterium]
MRLNVVAGSNLVFSGSAAAGGTGQTINPVAGTSTANTATVTVDGGGTVVCRTVNTMNIVVNNGLVTTNVNVTIGPRASSTLAGTPRGTIRSAGVTLAVNAGQTRTLLNNLTVAAGPTATINVPERSELTTPTGTVTYGGMINKTGGAGCGRSPRRTGR